MLQVRQGTGGATVCREVDAGPADIAHGSTRLTILIAFFLVLAAVGVKSYLWFHVPIGHDEFHCLGLVYEFQRGELTQPFQNLHVHFFSWLGAVSGNEVTQVMAARVVMLVLLMGTCGWMFLIGRGLLGPLGALFSVLCYLSLAYTTRNGATFRPDGPATFLFMLALYLFVARRDSAAANIGAGVAMAISCLFTIKSSLYFGAFAVLIVLRLLGPDDRRGTARRTLYFAGSFVLAFLLLYKVHAATFPPSASGHETQYLGAAFSRFMFVRFYPALGFLLPTIRFEPAIWFLLLLGFVACLHKVVTRRGESRQTEGYLLAMCVPMIWLAFFRNTAPYFYVFIMPSAMLLCGYGVGLLISRLERVSMRMVLVFVVVLGLVIVRSYVIAWPRLLPQATETTATQRELVSVIHKAFPDPVAYIDGCGMVASYPNAGFFMSSAGMTPYLDARVPVLKNALRETRPLFLLANVPHLDLRSEQPPESHAGLALLEEDWAALRSYFIHHWGPLWVVGKQLDLMQGTPAQSFEILTPGVYTVEATAEVSIDGAVRRDGDVLELEQGMHTIEGAGTGITLTLRWGDHLYCPQNEPRPGELFMGKLG